MLNLLRRGDRNLADATLVRERFIPVAIEAECWNVVIFEAFRVIELLMKGIVCLSGHAPRQSHEINFLVDDFLEILRAQRNHPHFLYTASAPNGNCYGIYSDGKSIQLLKQIGNTYTSLGTISRMEGWSIDALLGLELVVNGSTVSIRIRGTPVLTSCDSSVSDATHFTRRFERLPDPASVETLRNAAQMLRATREDGFFAMILFSKDEAKAAVRLMESAFEASKAFIPRGQ